MTALANRISAVIERLGEPCLVAGSATVGVFVTATPDEIATYVESGGRPVWIAYLPAENTFEAGASITWNGETRTVLIREELRLAETAVALVAVLG